MACTGAELPLPPAEGSARRVLFARMMCTAQALSHAATAAAWVHFAWQASLQVEARRLLVIMGSSGAGKTTLVSGVGGSLSGCQAAHAP